MNKIYDFAVIGGGASGMAAAVSASACGDRVLLIEKNNTVGRKIAASGNGRCNLMNSGDLRYFGDSLFAQKVFDEFTQNDLIRYWNGMGIQLCEENEGRMYPCTFHSATVTDAYRIRFKTLGTEILLNTKVINIRKTGSYFAIRTESNTYIASRVLIACGGPASPKLGGTDIGACILSDFGHRIIPVKPALCPLTTDKKSISGLAGIRIKCRIKLIDRESRSIMQEEGEVLFTERGVSGICAMQTARFAEKGYRIVLDLTGRIFSKPDQLIDILFRRQKQIAQFPPEILLNGILVPKMSYAVMKQAGIEMKGRKTGDLKENEIRIIARKCGSYILDISGNCGFEEAQVSAGGADSCEFNPETMESMLIPGLHAAGEVINVDGDCGGYNLMFATVSGIIAGLNGRKGMAI